MIPRWIYLNDMCGCIIQEQKERRRDQLNRTQESQHKHKETKKNITIIKEKFKGTKKEVILHHCILPYPFHSPL